MSISPIVDDLYRLQVTDLAGSARQVVVANVTYQGVEEMRPVLHFVGQSKRLVLSPEQVRQMIEITGTILYPKWVGISIILEPAGSRDVATIAIRPRNVKKWAPPMPAYISEDRRGWSIALIVVVALLSASVLFAALNLDLILVTVQQVRDNWPLR